MWKKLQENQPEDDQDYLVSYYDPSTESYSILRRAYYDGEIGRFLSLEGDSGYPLYVEVFMDMPEVKINEEEEKEEQEYPWQEMDRIKPGEGQKCWICTKKGFVLEGCYIGHYKYGYCFNCIPEIVPEDSVEYWMPFFKPASPEIYTLEKEYQEIYDKFFKSILCGKND